MDYMAFLLEIESRVIEKKSSLIAPPKPPKPLNRPQNPPHGDRFADSSRAAQSPSASPFRRANPFVFVPSTIETATGAAKICGALRSFRSLFAAARRGELPTDALTVEIDGEVLEVESATAACIEIESAWTNAARRCQSDRRDLTAPEADALGAATQFLETVTACYNGPGEARLDLDAIGAQLDEDFRAMQRKQRETKKPSEATG